MARGTPRRVSHATIGSRARLASTPTTIGMSKVAASLTNASVASTASTHDAWLDAAAYAPAATARSRSSRRREWYGSTTPPPATMRCSTFGSTGRRGGRRQYSRKPTAASHTAAEPTAIHQKRSAITAASRPAGSSAEAGAAQPGAAPAATSPRPSSGALGRGETRRGLIKNHCQPPPAFRPAASAVMARVLPTMSTGGDRLAGAGRPGGRRYGGRAPGQRCESCFLFRHETHLFGRTVRLGADGRGAPGLRGDIHAARGGDDRRHPDAGAGAEGAGADHQRGDRDRMERCRHS